MSQNRGEFENNPHPNPGTESNDKKAAASSKGDYIDFEEIK